MAKGVAARKAPAATTEAAADIEQGGRRVAQKNADRPADGGSEASRACHTTSTSSGRRRRRQGTWDANRRAAAPTDCGSAAGRSAAPADGHPAGIAFAPRAGGAGASWV